MSAKRQFLLGQDQELRPLHMGMNISFPAGYDVLGMFVVDGAPAEVIRPNQMGSGTTFSDIDPDRYLKIQKMYWVLDDPVNPQGNVWKGWIFSPFSKPKPHPAAGKADWRRPTFREIHLRKWLHEQNSDAFERHVASAAEGLSDCRPRYNEKVPPTSTIGPLEVERRRTKGWALIKGEEFDKLWEVKDERE